MKTLSLVLVRLLVIALLIGVGLAFYDPTIIPNESLQKYFITLKSPQTAQRFRQTTLGISQTASEFIEKPPLIPEAASQLVQQSAQSYAKQQIDSVKVRICEELLGQKVVINEASPAGSN